MTPIYETDRLYEFLRPMQDWLFRHSYRRFEQVGLDKIPTDGAVIYAPNHCNALCDALAVLSIGRERKVFVARADIFRKPLLRKILTWLKIMPIRRMRDGANAVLHNDETEQIAVETLRNGVKFCILPEGTHRTKHSLLPLKKGIFRIALRANEEFGKEKPDEITKISVIIRLQMAAEEIANAAASIADVVLRGLGEHPVIQMSIQESEVTIEKATVSDDSILVGKKFGEIRLGSISGMYVIAIKRGNQYIYGPNKNTEIKAGDVLIARGPEESADYFIDIATGAEKEL